MRLYSILLLLIMFTLQPVNLFAGVEVNEFSSAEKEQQFKRLVNELRCLVCQNQNLADSNSELAQDLRKEVFGMIQDGKTEAEIIDFMVARYGDFVLYRPPFKPVTFLLWVGPFIILFLAVLVLVTFVRKNKTAQSVELSEEETKKVAALLDTSEKSDVKEGNK